MSYVTPALLMVAYGERELLEATSTTDPDRRVNSELLALTISGGDRAAYSAEEISAADTVLAAIESVCSQAVAKVNAAIRARWPTLTLPISPAPADIARIALWIARYFLHDLIRDEERSLIYRRYKDALAELVALRRGDTDLGIEPPTSTTSSASPKVSAPAETFTSSVLSTMP